MSNYTKATNFATKDALITGDPNKIVKGTEINTEYDAIAVAVNSKLDSGAASSITSAMLVTDAVTAIKMSASAYGPTDIKNVGFTAVPGSNTMVISLKTQAGTDPSATDPAEITFRNATLTSGTWNKRSVTAALSTTISSGSTGGTTSTNQSRIMVLAIDNAGTVELAWCNYAGSAVLDEATVISTTAEGGAGAADSANVIYSTTARTNVPFRILGYFESTQATAGTWVTTPSVIQYGIGSALKSIQGQMGTVTATTSGTTIDFTGIPAWVRRITFSMIGVSTNGTSILQLQIGDAGGMEVTNYLGSVTNCTSAASANHSIGFALSSAAITAATVQHGSITLVLVDPATNTWSVTGCIGISNAATNIVIAGTKALSQILTQVRLTAFNGTDTFDAGSVNIFYE